MEKIWKLEEIRNIYNKPLIELVFEAATVHREYHDPREVQVSTLLSIKTGGCPEDCGYCPQAARYHTDIEANDLMSLEQVKTAAKDAQESGSSRLCMGAAWRNVKDDDDFDQPYLFHTITLKLIPRDNFSHLLGEFSPHHSCHETLYQRGLSG